MDAAEAVWSSLRAICVLSNVVEILFFSPCYSVAPHLSASLSLAGSPLDLHHGGSLPCGFGQQVEGDPADHRAGEKDHPSPPAPTFQLTASLNRSPQQLPYRPFIISSEHSQGPPNSSFSSSLQPEWECSPLLLPHGASSSISCWHPFNCPPW